MLNSRKLTFALGIVVILFNFQWHNYVEASLVRRLVGPSEAEFYQGNQPTSGTDSLNKRLAETHNVEVLLEERDFDENSAASVSNEKLTRLQRTDKHHKYHDTAYSALKNAHNNKKLQKELLRQADANYNVDYNAMMDILLDKYNDQSEQADMSGRELNEIMSSIKRTKYNKVISDEELAFLEVLFRQELKAEEKQHMKAHKPVNKVVDVKEKLLLEKDYNKNLKGQLDGPITTSNDIPLSDTSMSFNTAQGLSLNAAPSLVAQQKNGVIDPSFSDKIDQLKQQNDYLFLFVVAGCTLAGVVALVAAGVCWYSIHKTKAAPSSDFGVKSGGLFNSGSGGSVKSNSSGDRRLAQSAQMYHYQHQKQQMIAMEKANNETKPDNSDNSEGETEEGDYTVYECPGLAPTGEMEVKNPLFKEDISNTNMFSSSMISMPPAYSTLTSEQANEKKENDKQPQLIDINENKPTETDKQTDDKETKAKEPTVTSQESTQKQ